MVQISKYFMIQSLLSEVLPVSNHQFLQGQKSFFLNFIIAMGQQAHNGHFSTNVLQDPITYY